MKSLALAALLALSACNSFTPSSRFDGTPMFVVSNLTPGKLAGTWYEVASFPTSFQEGCMATTAEYTPRTDGRIGIRNTCRVVDQPGTIRQIEGVGTITAPGQLAVHLDGVPVSGRLWVLDISRDGRTLLLGTPNRRAGWMLHRDAHVTPEQLDRAREVFRANGYDVAALQRTRQGALWMR